eukprot:scaffold212539_cov23-Cyclotella_meneghiniana.AAC.1
MARYGVSSFGELKEVLNTLLPEHGEREMDEIIEQRILANKVSAPFRLYFHVYALILDPGKADNESDERRSCWS